jgi:soluble lytic murein transglycosylase-like protein
MKTLNHIILCFLMLTTKYSLAQEALCFNEAGGKYHIDPLLLQAIAEVESSLNTQAINYNRRKGKVTSIDYGVMQINSSHLKELAPMGVTKEDLLSDPCLNVNVGAWILARNLRAGGVSWNTIGSYNAGFAQDRLIFRNIYSDKIYRKYKVLLKRERGIEI